MIEAAEKPQSPGRRQLVLGLLPLLSGVGAAHAQEEPDGLARIRANGALKVALYNAFPPFSAQSAQGMQGQTGMIDITGHTDRSGSRDANVELAKRRALAVRDALVAAGVSAERLRLKPPQDVVGSGSDADARRVEITPGS